MHEEHVGGRVRSWSASWAPGGRRRRSPVLRHALGARSRPAAARAVSISVAEGRGGHLPRLPPSSSPGPAARQADSGHHGACTPHSACPLAPMQALMACGTPGLQRRGCSRRLGCATNRQQHGARASARTGHVHQARARPSCRAALHAAALLPSPLTPVRPAAGLCGGARITSGLQGPPGRRGRRAGTPGAAGCRQLPPAGVCRML